MKLIIKLYQIDPNLTSKMNMSLFLHLNKDHQLTSCKTNSCMFVITKSIHTCLISNKCFLNQERNVHRSRNGGWLILMWEGKILCIFFTTALLWIMDSYFGQKPQLKVKMSKLYIYFFYSHTDFPLHKTWIDGLEWFGILVDYCLSDVWTILTAPIHYNSKLFNATFLQIRPDKETNSSTSWMAWGWIHFQWILMYGLTIHLKQHALWTLACGSTLTDWHVQSQFSCCHPCLYHKCDVVTAMIMLSPCRRTRFRGN